MNEINKFEAVAVKAVEAANVAMNSGRSGDSVNTNGMSDIGKAIIGKVNDYSFSPSVRAKSFLKEGYSALTRLGVSVKIGSQEYSQILAAYELIEVAAEKMGIEI